VLLMEVSQTIARHMPECEIVELHHDRKLDAPSGTAKRTAELIDAAGGHVHQPIHSVRLPGLVAHPDVIFGGVGLTLALRHDSIDRSSFMPGVIRVAVAGAAGRMGEAVCAAVEAAEDTVLAGRADPSLGVELADVLGEADVVVDFTVPDTALGNVRACLEAGVHAVVGTTGFDLDAAREAAEASQANCFVAPNFAIGAVLLMEVSQTIARHMPECEIVELHHDKKLDAPSGTAKRTQELIDAAGGNVHQPIHSVRLPGLVAHQEVIFGGVGQTLAIRHDSIDRRSFMPGVVLACRKVADLPDRFTVGLEKLL
jgi:4-hydroxy-tetrahydrodipicolinate reductase